MAKKLLVEGLDWGVTQAELRSAFAPFGRVVEARVATDWETGRSRGFGHISYDDETSARLAIETMDGASLRGKVLRVMEAPETGQRDIYRGGDYGRGARGQRQRDYRGGDYSDSRSETKDARVYRSANFGYADGPTKKSSYRAANFDGAGRAPKPPKVDAPPAEDPKGAAADAADAPKPTQGDGGSTPAKAKGPKRGGGHRDADKGWKASRNEGVGDSGKTFG